MFVASIFDTLIVQPIFNLLVFIYAILPGHNFGLAIILFTIVIRLLMWPLVKKQLHQAKKMRELQPELKRIKAETKGDRQKESLMVMELYKEREVSPFGSIGILIVQFIILIGLYVGLTHVVKDPRAIVDNAYGWLQNLPWLKALAADIGRFDETLFGLVDLTRPAIGSQGFYAPAMVLVIGSAVIQYLQSVQLMPKPKDGRTLRQILREAGQGKQSDQSEVTAAVGRSTRFFIPALIFIFTVNLASGLSLYWFVGGLVAFIQQSRILKQDEEELEAIAREPDPKPAAVEGEVIEKKKPHSKTKKAKSSKSNKKRRRR